MNDYRKWAEFRDKLDAGELLTPQEQAHYEILQASDPTAQRENAVLRELSQFADAPPDSADAATAERVLQAVQRRDPGNVVPLRPGTAPPTEERPAGSQKWHFAVAGAVAAAALALLIVLPSSGDPSETSGSTARWALALCEGQVQVDAQSALPGVDLQPGAVLVTQEGKACVRLGELASACLDRHSRARVPAPEEGRHALSVEQGRVVVSVAPMPAGSRFVLEGSGVEATALGTQYALELSTGGRVIVGVLEGKVRVERGGSSASVLPGQQTLVEHEVGAPTALEDSRAQAYRQLLADRSLWDHEGVVLSVHTEPSGAQITLDAQPLGRSPLSLLVSPGTRTAAVELEGYERQHRTFTVAPEEQHSEQSFTLRSASAQNEPEAPTPSSADLPADGATTASSRAQAPVIPGAKPASTPQALLQRARELVARGSWSAAAQKYQQLRREHPGSAEARTVLVALGQLQLDRLGNPGAANRSFAAYLAGGGALAQEARYGRIRALGALGAQAKEKSAITDYLKRHPNSVDSAALKKRLQRLSE